MRVIFFILMSFSSVFPDRLLNITMDDILDLVIHIDKETGLMWDTDSVIRDWEGAKELCRNSKLGGYDDWRLPTIEELRTIADQSKYNPAIKSGFQYVTSYGYWSSSPDVSDPKFAWGVFFDDGGSYALDKTDKFNVMCVRAGQSDTLSDDFSFGKIVDYFIKKELDSIQKPPKELKLVKDEFETTAEFQARVAKTKKKQKRLIAEYKKKVAITKQTAKPKAIKKALEVKWGKPLLKDIHYDADNGYFVANATFEAKKDFHKKVAIKIPRKKARGFKRDFSTLKPEAVFSYDGKSVALQGIRVPYAKKFYVVQFTDVNLGDTVMAVNLKNDYGVDTDIDTSISVASADLNTLDTSKLKDYHKLERMLQKSEAVPKDSHKWLFVIGIEQYEYTDNIAYAKRTAQMFKKVMQKKLGVPERNCFTLLDDKATQADIKNRFKKLLRRVKNGDTVYFYYNGHGVPVPQLKNEPFMLASNSEPDFIADEKFFSLQNIYNELSKSKASKVVAFVDSCFSGVTDGKAVLKGVAATKMVPRSVSFDKDKMVVLTAGNAHQYSNGYDRRGYRLFSYYVMKNIIEGDKSVKELYKDTKKQTYERSLEEYGDSRTQEPQIEGNFRMKL